VTAADLLDALGAAGVRLAARDGRLQLRGPTGSLTEALRREVARTKGALLALLAEESGIPTAGDIATMPSVNIGGKLFTYSPRWSGGRLAAADGLLAFDVETDVVDLKREVPRLALASASAGEAASCLVHPDDLGAFVRAHDGLDLVCHNAAFDFWAVERHLRLRGEDAALAAWWETAEANRLHDSMLLDMLLRLAVDDAFPDPRDLATVAREYTCLEISKADPFRLRYGEIIGKDWSGVERGFFEYAIKDAVVTRLAYLAIRERAVALADGSPARRDVLPDARERFGLLTEAVQVKKAIALTQVTRNGMCVDLASVREGEAELRRSLGEAVSRVRALCPGLYNTDRQGDLVLTRTGAPSRSAKALDVQLAKVAEEVRRETGIVPKIPLTLRGRRPSASTKAWAEYSHLHPFLASWTEAEELSKLNQFFAHLQHDQVHPCYTTLVRSGRTSCRDPNVQQIPRDGPLRHAFVASTGHLLLAVDYAFIELRTLAAVCLLRHGSSDLAEVIKAGADPHAHTAAMMLGVEPGEFSRWKEDPGRKGAYTAARQAAKAVNFGVPGGLGAESLAAYARRTYEVPLTTEEARQRRERLVKDVYPELALYLAEDAAAVVAGNLRAPVVDVRQALGDVSLTAVRKVLEGDPRRADGAPYKETFVSRVWAALAGLNRYPDLQGALENRTPGKPLARAVCQAAVATLTGRLRGRVRYSQARNTPFQGLAADGAALALFALVKEGFRVVGFVHDEVLVELPDEGGYVSEAKVRRVEEILCREMEEVLVGGIPAACESTLSARWEKGAGLAIGDGKVFPAVPLNDEAGGG
jgi:hypothetical protein